MASGGWSSTWIPSGHREPTFHKDAFWWDDDDDDDDDEDDDDDDDVDDDYFLVG